MKGIGILFVMLIMAMQIIAQDIPPQESEAMKELKEIQKLMKDSEESLMGASLGKAALDQEEIMKMLEELTKEGADKFKKNPKLLADKFFERSTKRQKEAIDRIEKLIKKAKESQDPKNQQSQPQRPNNPSNPYNPTNNNAAKPYTPRAKSSPSKFRSIADRDGEWGNLPVKEREAILHERRAIDQFPPEFQEMLKEYWKQLMKEGLGDD